MGLLDFFKGGKNEVVGSKINELSEEEKKRINDSFVPKLTESARNEYYRDKSGDTGTANVNTKLNPILKQEGRGYVFKNKEEEKKCKIAGTTFSNYSDSYSNARNDNEKRQYLIAIEGIKTDIANIDHPDADKLRTAIDKFLEDDVRNQINEKSA